jgi:hypothetical protein
MQSGMNLRTRLVRICFIAPKAYLLFNPDVKELFGGAEVDLYFLATELARDKNYAAGFITADYEQEKFDIIFSTWITEYLDKEQFSGRRLF